MGDAILTAFPIWEFLLFAKITYFNTYSIFYCQLRRHATFAALVCFCLWNCILASKNHVYSQRDKYFQGMLYPCGYTSGAHSNMPIGTQQQFQPFWQCCPCFFTIVVVTIPKPCSENAAALLPIHKKMAQRCLSNKKTRQDVSFYELQWDEMAVYIEGITPNCQWRKNVKSK